MKLLMINSTTWLKIRDKGTILAENPYLILGELSKEEVLQIITKWAKLHDNGLIIFRSIYNYGFTDQINQYFYKKNKKIEVIVFPKLNTSDNKQSAYILGGEFSYPLTKHFRMLLAKKQKPFLFVRPKEVEFIVLSYIMYLELIEAYLISIGDVCKSTDIDIEIVKKALSIYLNSNLFIQKTPSNNTRTLSYAEKNNPLFNTKLIKLTERIIDDDRYWFIRQLKMLNRVFQLKSITIYGIEDDEKLIRDLSFLFTIKVFEVVEKDVISTSNRIIIENNKYEAAKGSDVLIFLNNNNNYSDISLAKLSKVVSKRIIIDNANIFNIKEMKAENWLYISKGRRNVYNI